MGRAEEVVLHNDSLYDCWSFYAELSCAAKMFSTLKQSCLIALHLHVKNCLCASDANSAE